VKLKTKKMKTLVKASFIVAVAAIVFTGCKKGENDPFLSLKSRTSRLSKEWKLTSADYTTTNKTTLTGLDYTSSNHYTYDGTNMNAAGSVTWGTNTSTTNSSKPFSIILEFTKEGSLEQTVSDDGDVSIDAGYWSWLLKNKDLDLSNKEAIVISFASNSDYTYTGTSISPNEVMVFDKLAADEFIISYDYTETYTGGDVFTRMGTMTFQEK
jgi:hypothetical protein